MLMIVSRSSLLDDLLRVLAELGVNASTHLPEVHGRGEAGSALGTFAHPGSNSVVLAAVDDTAAERVGAELRAFHDRTAARQRGAQIPFRVFVLPCTQVV